MQNPESVAQKMAGGEGMVDMEVCMYCKYFLKNLLRGLEKSSWSQTPRPPCLDFPPSLTVMGLRFIGYIGHPFLLDLNTYTYT